MSLWTFVAAEPFDLKLWQLGNETSYDYTDADSDGVADEILSITDPYEREKLFDYNSDGRLASLTNREVADVLNFIRNGWGNHGSEISEADISRMRHEIERKPKHYVPGEQK